MGGELGVWISRMACCRATGWEGDRMQIAKSNDDGTRAVGVVGRDTAETERPRTYIGLGEYKRVVVR